jgi:hypothetical protein
MHVAAYITKMSPGHFEGVRATLLRVAQPWLHSDPGMLDVVMVGKGETICELRSGGDPQFSAPLVIAEHPFASRYTNFNFLLILSLQLTFLTAHQGSQLSLIRFRAAFSSKNVYFCQGGMSIITGKDKARKGPRKVNDRQINFMLLSDSKPPPCYTLSVFSGSH